MEMYDAVPIVPMVTSRLIANALTNVKIQPLWLNRRSDGAYLPFLPTNGVS